MNWIKYCLISIKNQNVNLFRVARILIYKASLGKNRFTDIASANTNKQTKTGKNMSNLTWESEFRIVQQQRRNQNRRPTTPGTHVCGVQARKKMSLEIFSSLEFDSFDQNKSGKACHVYNSHSCAQNAKSICLFPEMFGAKITIFLLNFIEKKKVTKIRNLSH